MDNHPSPIKNISWQTYEYIHSVKTADWFWAVGIIAGAIAIASAIYGNWLFAGLIIIATVTLVMFATQTPKTISVTVNPNGIKVNNILYPYSSLDSFWIERRLGEPKLLLKPNKTFAPLISIPIAHDASTDSIQDLLNDYLLEEELNEPFLYHIMQFLGF